MRYSTALKFFGPITLALNCSKKEWQRAMSERRFATVYHGESETEPEFALVGHHGCSNTLFKIVFANPLPSDVNNLTGLRNSFEFWQLAARYAAHPKATT